MTITTNDTRDEYTASAGQTVFNYTFKIFADTDLNVYQTPSGQTANDTTDLITAYTVAGVGASTGGTITLTTPASAGDLITIVSDIPESRTTDYQYDGDFIPDVVNDDFDRVVSLVKQVNDRANRGLAFQESEQGSSGFTLPQPVAGYYVRWNGTLDGFENVPFTTTDPGAPSLTVATLANVTDADTGDWRYVQGYSTVGDGGHGVWVLTSGNFTTELAADTLNGVYLEYSGEDGSTRAWVRAREGDIVHSLWFGTTQDALQASLDFMSANTVLVIDPYTYTISTPITTTLPGHNTILAEGAVFNCTHDGLVFDFNVTDVAQTPMLRWSGGKFVNSAGTKTASLALYFEDWRNVKVENTRFEGFHTAVHAVDRDTFTIQNCHFYNNTYHLSFDNTGSGGSWGNLILKAIDNHFSLTGCTAGIYIDGVTGAIEIDGNSFNGVSASGIDIHIKNTGAISGVRGITVSNNHFEQGVTGQKYVYLEDNDNHPYYAVNITGNLFNDDGPDAVVIEHAWKPEITGNSFSQSTSTPIDLNADCLGVHIGPNYFTPTSTIVFACDRSEITVYPYKIIPANVTAVTGYDGDSFSTGSATIDMSTAISTIFPTIITPRGYDIVLQAADSASAANSTLRAELSKNASTTFYNRLMTRVGDATDDNKVCQLGFVAADSNGDLYFNCIASGTDTLDVWLGVAAIHL